MNDAYTGHASPSPVFRIWLWGPFRVERKVGEAFSVVQTTEWGGSSYPRLLLKFLLCCPGRRVRREVILNQLWPEEEIEQATSNLNIATSKLRHFLRPTGKQESLLVTENTASIYHLPDQSIIWVDMDAARHALEAAERLGRTSGNVSPLLEEAAGFWERGEFLEGDDGQWIVGKRAMRERESYRGRIWLAEAYARQGMPGRAETIFATLLEDDPFDEDILCRFMGILSQQGMTSQALKMYAQAEKQFEQEGLELAEATRNFAACLKKERQTPSLELLFEEKMEKIPSRSRTALKPESLSPLGLSPFSQAITQGIIQAVRELETVQGVTMMAFDPYKRETLQKLAAALLAVTGLSQAELLTGPYTRQGEPLTLTEQASSWNEETLKCFEVLIAHSWQLGRGKRHDIALARAIAASNLPLLTAFAHQPSPHQQQAAGLAAQWHRICTVLGYHTENLDVAEAHIKKAVVASKIAGIPDLIVATLGSYALVFFYAHRPTQALEKCLEAEQYIDQTTPAIQSLLYRRKAACLAQMQEKHQALVMLDLACEAFYRQPSNEALPPYAEHEEFELLLWEGITRYQIGQHDAAQRVLEKFAPSEPLSCLPERVRTGFLNNLVFAELQKPGYQCDLERSTTLWRQAAQAAIHLQSQLRYDEVGYAYNNLLQRFPHEPRTKELRDHLVKWA